jgi:ribonuclease R
MKERIIDVLHQDKYKGITIEELKEVIGIESSKEFKEMVKSVNQLIEECIIIESGSHHLNLIEDTDFMTGRLDLKERGFGFVIPDDPSQNDIFIRSDHIFDAMNRDRVLVYVNNKKSGIRQEGEIRRVVKRNYTHIIGIVQMRRNHAYILPDDKSIKQQVMIKSELLHGAKKDDVVRAKIINYSFRGKIECVVTDILGNKNDAGVSVLSKILKHNVDPLFPESVLQEAKAFDTSISEEDKRGRVDLTKERIITIDGDDSKDFDDAVIVKQLDNGNYHLGVHIADVSHYVKHMSLLDKEAYERGTSIYMPGHVIPMLPERLSNGLCSLVPNKERLTISCDMEINKNGKVVKYDIYPSVIESYQRMTYNKVNKIFNGDVELSERYVDLVGMFYDMRNLAKILKKNREKHGSINFETEEAYFVFDDQGKVSDIKKRERGIAENIIEEFMLKANQVVAEHVYWLNLPFIYRVHEKPKEEKLHRLLKMASALGIPVKANNEISHHELQKLLENVAGKEYEKGINLLVLRSMQKAIYSDVSLGHYGLNFRFYTHFTSPIRRYPDLIVHRLLRQYLFQEEKAHDAITYYGEHMTEIASKASENERKAILLEREVVDMKKAEYMAKFINKRFHGIINSVTSFGLYVSLENTVEGLVHISNLKDDYYFFDEDLLMLIGERRKRKFKVGDPLYVEVTKVNVAEGEIDFEVVKV